MKYILISGIRTSASNPYSHTIEDDFFYNEYFNSRNLNHSFYLSQYSIEKIKQRGGSTKNLRPLNSFRIAPQEQSIIIFFGFTETQVAVFCLCNAIRMMSNGTKIILVPTNNFSKARTKRLRWQLRIFFKLLSPFIKSIQLHTKYELNLVRWLSKNMAEKCVIKKHQLMIPRDVMLPSRNSTADPKIKISFFGPIKADKRLDDFVELIQGDINNVADYRIFNVDAAVLIDALPNIERLPNVVVSSSDRVEKEYYERAIATSDLVFMGHTRDFAGKLSGVLCDCVALGVPYISQRMEPMQDYELTYGKLGYLYDASQPDWTSIFFNMVSRGELEKIKINLRRMSSEHALVDIYRDLDRAFLS